MASASTGCLSGALPITQWNDNRIFTVRSSYNEDDMRSLALVISNYTFNCAGKISQWGLSWYGYSRSTTTKVHFIFYVLRPDPQNKCHLFTVGKNNKMLNIELGSNFSTSQNRDIAIPTDERITVQAGDSVALIVQVLNSRRRVYFYLKGKTRNSNTLHYKRYDDDQFMPFDSSRLCNYASFSTTNVSPYFTAIVGRK